MKRLPALRLRYWVLPLILAGLAAGAFVPARLATTAEAGADHEPVDGATLCSRAQDRSDRGDLPVNQNSRPCDHCLSPMGNAPIALPIPPGH